VIIEQEPDRVVVTGDHEVDASGSQLVSDETDDRDAQALGLTDGDHLGSLRSMMKIALGRAFMFLTPPRLARSSRVGLGRHPLTRRQQGELSSVSMRFQVVEAPGSAR